MMAKRIGLPPHDTHTFQVEVAEGEKLTGRFCCKSATMQIQGFDSSADLLVVPLGNAQVILGTVWLKSLGPTLWNFSRKTLCFWKEGKCISTWSSC